MRRYTLIPRLRTPRPRSGSAPALRTPRPQGNSRFAADPAPPRSRSDRDPGATGVQHRGVGCDKDQLAEVELVPTTPPDRAKLIGLAAEICSAKVGLSKMKRRIKTLLKLNSIRLLNNKYKFGFRTGFSNIGRVIRI